MRANARNEDGQVLVMVALTMLGLLSVVGLVSDGGLVFSRRRDLQNAADAAAAAGAMQIDEAAYRSAGTVILDEGAARETAAAYLELEDGIT
ncbi:MAG: pilus assembly protein TadG-related protein, partial [Dehalococcoidia bacterium]